MGDNDGRPPRYQSRVNMSNFRPINRTGLTYEYVAFNIGPVPYVVRLD